jgi:hypothetical protein
MRTIVWTALLAVCIASRGQAQHIGRALDSTEVKVFLTVLQEWAGKDVIAVRADMSNVASVMLATALARTLGVPGPDAVTARDMPLPVCSGSREKTPEGAVRGRVVFVSWGLAETADRAILSATSQCALNGDPVATGSSQRMKRGADGAWRKDGPPAAMVS